MNISGRWTPFIAALVLLAVAPFLPEWTPGLLSVLAAMLFYAVSREITVSVALACLGFLNITGILPTLVLCASLLIVFGKELIAVYFNDSPYEYPLILIASFLLMIGVMEYLQSYSWLSAVVGATFVVMLHSIMGSSREALTGELFGVAIIMLVIDKLQFAPSLGLVAIAAIIAFSFSYIAYRAKTADLPGLFSAALMGIILIVFTGISGFLVMLSFFIIAAAATRYKMDYKKSIHVEQESGGVRGYVNVFANGLVSCIAAICFGATELPVFLVIYLGSVATAAADTVAGEIGVTSGKPFLITTMRRVPAGTNGGVSMLGELAGLMGAFFVSIVAFLLGLADLSIFIAAVAGGFIGANIDSLFGELFENKHYIGNAGTNLLATFSGGIVSALIFLLFELFGLMA